MRHRGPARRDRVAMAVLILVVGLLAAPASAQSFERATETQANTAYFHFFRPGEATIQVSVWGTVPLPGIYEIQTGTNLEQLLSMAGAPPLETTDRSSRREVIFRVFRPTGAQRDLLYQASLDEMIQTPGQYPTLAHGDVFVVETKVHNRFGWRDAFTITTGLASVALLVERLVRLND